MITQFSKKTCMFLITLSAVGLIFGAALILFSGIFTIVAYNIIVSIFHLSVTIDVLQNSIQSLFLIPIFIVILFNTCVFVKYDDRSKAILLILMLVVLAFAVVYGNYVSAYAHIESDLASEYILAKECLLEKSIMPLGWNYSTEIRILNTQLIAAPLFLFFSNWVLVKSLVSLVSCAFLFCAFLFLAKRIEINNCWIKFLCAIFIVSPFSDNIWGVVSWGNYYIPHIIISFIYVAIYMDLIDYTSNQKKSKYIVFGIIAFISGLSSVRYLVIFQFPLAVAVMWKEALDLSKKI